MGNTFYKKNNFIQNENNNNKLSNIDNNTNMNEYDISDIIKDGFLWKRGGGRISSAWKYRWFSLSTKRKVIFYYKSKEDAKPRGTIEFSGYKVELYNDPIKENSFKLVPDQLEKRTWYLAAASIDDRNSWIHSIQAALEDHASFENINKNFSRLSTVPVEPRQTFNSLNIAPENIEWQNIFLGKGGSGLVQKGLLYRTTEVAIKSINNVAEFISDEEQNEFIREIEMLSNLRHPNIVTMIGYCIKDNKMFLITEYVAGGTLADVIYNTTRKIDIFLQIELLISLTKGMVYIHSNKIIHRDLKPGNILIEHLSSAKIKVCDFGVSRMTSLVETSKNVGTLAYAAPELSTNHSNKVDVYSFAIIAWEIYNGKQAWKDKKTPWEISEHVAKGERPPLDEKCPFYSIITKCWDGNPQKRPPFSEVFEKLNLLKGSIMMGDQKPPSQKMLDFLKAKKSVIWHEFSKFLAKELNIYPKDFESLKPILTDENDLVRLEFWEEFLKWFSPILISDEYLNTQGNGKPTQRVGWKLNEILDIVGQSWFFGFLSTNDAKDILSNKSAGSFLFRFSTTQPGMYTLSVVDMKSDVYHWRISCEKLQRPIFKIDNVPYPRLGEIIRKHSMQPLVNTSNPNVKVLLMNACDRNKELDKKKYPLNIQQNALDEYIYD